GGAADVEPDGGIAKGAEEFAFEAVLARDLSHYLHESPGDGASDFFRWRKAERRDVARSEAGFVADRVRIPGGFLFDDGADQRGIERVLGCGGASEQNEFGGSRHGVA